MIATQLGDKLIQLFGLFRVKPAAGSSASGSPAASPYSGQSPAGAGRRRPGCWPDGWHAPAGRYAQARWRPDRSASLCARRKAGAFEQTGRRRFSAIDAAPPADFQSPSFRGTDARAGRFVPPIRAIPLPGSPSRCWSRSIMGAAGRFIETGQAVKNGGFPRRLGQLRKRSPAGAARETLLTASRPPKRIIRPFTDNIG